MRADSQGRQKQERGRSEEDIAVDDPTALGICLFGLAVAVAVPVVDRQNI